MISVNDTELVQLVGQIRITAFFMAAPIFGTRIVSARVRVVLAVAITIILAPILPPLPTVNALSLNLLLLVLHPANGVSVTIVSQFYMLTTTLLFLSINGHLALLQILIDSFTVLPISNSGLKAEMFYRIAELGGWMFGSALTISLPVLTALLLVNIAFGVMSRSAPQMNIFAVGFPITLIFGLLIMWVGFSALLPTYLEFIDQGMIFTKNLLK